jgi:GT2 family glycosyltransferase
MKKVNIAVLLTCHNRKNKTVACLESLYRASIPAKYEIEIFLTDDGSTDGTSEVVQKLFPDIHVVKGDGSLYWAGGMRLAWETAMNKNYYDAYLLLNDDVDLYSDFFFKLLEADEYAYEKTGKKGIYSGATVDENNGKVTYGGSRVINNLLIVKMRMIKPAGQPIECDVTNANVLWVSKEVVDEIGIFDKHFTHSMADYDYSLQAVRKKMPVLLASEVCGVCLDDHGRNWRSNNFTLKERIAYLKSPKGLALNEYLYYIGKHFPLYIPYSFIMLWLKTLLPIIWDRVKN